MQVRAIIFGMALAVCGTDQALASDQGVTKWACKADGELRTYSDGRQSFVSTKFAATYITGRSEGYWLYGAMRVWERDGDAYVATSPIGGGLSIVVSIFPASNEYSWMTLRTDGTIFQRRDGSCVKEDLVPEPVRAASASVGIRILDAQYGIEGRTANRVPAVSGRCAGRSRCAVPVQNDVLGPDPVYMSVKTLWVTYQCSGDAGSRRVSAREDTMLNLQC